MVRKGEIPWRVGLAGLAAAASLACSSVNPYLESSAAFEKERIEWQQRDPNYIFLGEIVIYKNDNLSVRDFPTQVNNNNSWRNIVSINGTNISGADFFVVKNPRVVQRQLGRDNYATPIPYYEPWLQLDGEVTNGLSLKKRKLYISLSNETSGHVRWKEARGRLINVKANQDGSFTVLEQSPGQIEDVVIPKDEVGIVTFGR